MGNRTDAQLVTQYLNNSDELALEALVRRYMAQIYRYAHRYTGNADTAADITQETFVKAWKHLKRFDRSRNFQSWLFAIAKNTAVDWLRTKKPVSLEEPDTLMDESPSILDQLSGRQQSRQLAVALAQLPNDVRIVVQLHTQDELTFREISEQLTKPLHTVKSQYRRALALLRSTLKPLA